MAVRRANDHIFKVNEDIKVFILDLEERSHTCNMFRMDEIPCPHAIAVLKEMNLDHYNYCSDYYMKETMLVTYCEMVYPIEHEATWMLLNEFQKYVASSFSRHNKSWKTEEKKI
ncbi:hypothetical protein PHJA_001343800 [Phtheirospermum japonicum]|uniref:SWIM-type domain-containing protein n=1 Tax=Phtheirospermum japonicum TaxID=374723 RepID=A0A830BVJ9_9LAMI|nr:hypothetical protein PHJA_001343800 [Phtheirospermum japonicum]